MVKIYNRYDGSIVCETIGGTLEGADLEGADLSGADLRRADLSGADLRGADLEGADLEGAKTTFCIVNFSNEEYEQAKQFVEGLKNTHN